MKRVLTLAVMISAFGLLSFGATRTIRGKITDSKCTGANHDAACVKNCIKAGASPVLVTKAGKIYKISNPDAIQGHEGETVAVSGDVSGDSINVTNVKTLSAGGRHKKAPAAAS